MNLQIPHILDSIVDVSAYASRLMRGWMEIVTIAIHSDNLDAQSTDVTTYGNSYIDAVSNITVFLRADAILDEWVTVRHNSMHGNITVTDGIGYAILTEIGTVVTFKFKSGGWIIGA